MRVHAPCGAPLLRSLCPRPSRPARAHAARADVRARAAPPQSGLKSGTTYSFRARAFAGDGSDGLGRWGAFGPATPPLRTLLPELPKDCSESLKVPSKVLAAQAEVRAAGAARARTPRRKPR